MSIFISKRHYLLTKFNIIFIYSYNPVDSGCAVPLDFNNNMVCFTFYHYGYWYSTDVETTPGTTTGSCSMHTTLLGLVSAIIKIFGILLNNFT